MDLYLFTLGLSFGVLVLLALLGFGHHHTTGKTAPLHGLKFHKGHQPPSAARGHQHHDVHPGLGAALLAMLSPRTFCGFLLGFGATGVLLRAIVPVPPVTLFGLAVLGGGAFEFFVLRPLWNFLFGFASAPARTLDTLTLEEGHAATDFDAAGHGLIAVHLDGQIRQILGKLIPEERAAHAPRVRTGDRLFIRAVDHRRNTCTVSRQSC